MSKVLIVAEHANGEQPSYPPGVHPVPLDALSDKNLQRRERESQPDDADEIKLGLLAARSGLFDQDQHHDHARYRQR